MQNNQKEEEVCAGFLVRLVAYAIDKVIVVIGLAIVGLISAYPKAAFPDFILFKAAIFEYSIWDIIVYALGASYFIVMTYFSGSTLGKKLFNLRVVSEKGEKLSFIDVLYRETIGRFLSSFLDIGYIFIFVDQRALHDRLCDTKVIYAKKVKVIYYNVPYYAGVATGYPNQVQLPTNDIQKNQTVQTKQQDTNQTVKELLKNKNNNEDLNSSSNIEKVIKVEEKESCKEKEPKEKENSSSQEKSE